MVGVITPLRGRVVVRQLEPTRHGLLYLPDTTWDTIRTEDRQLGKLAQSSHRGRVLSMGPPALQYGHEVPHGFDVGDEVLFVYASGGTEVSRKSTWTDGEPCVWIAQEEVLAVKETT